MLNGDFQEGNTIVPIITPVDFSTGANTGTPVNMAGYERAVFVLYGGIGTAAQDPIFKLEQATSKAGVYKDLLFTRVRSKVGALLSAVNDYTLTTQTASATVTVTSAASEKMISVEIRADQLDVSNGYTWVRMSVADVGANAQIACAFAIMVNGRYMAPTMPTPLT